MKGYILPSTLSDKRQPTYQTSPPTRWASISNGRPGPANAFHSRHAWGQLHQAAVVKGPWVSDTQQCRTGQLAAMLAICAAPTQGRLPDRNNTLRCGSTWTGPGPTNQAAAAAAAKCRATPL